MYDKDVLITFIYPFCLRFIWFAQAIKYVINCTCWREATFLELISKSYINKEFIGKNLFANIQKTKKTIKQKTEKTKKRKNKTNNKKQKQNKNEPKKKKKDKKP